MPRITRMFFLLANASSKSARFVNGFKHRGRMDQRIGARTFHLRRYCVLLAPHFPNSHGNFGVLQLLLKRLG